MLALAGTGSASDRAIAVAAAEAGARIALGTVAKVREQEYAMHSIANEAWNIGAEQFVCVMDGGDAAELASFAAQVWDTFAACDLLVCSQFLYTGAPLDELSQDEWEATLRANLTAPFLAAQAFGRLMERDGAGTVLFVRDGGVRGDAAYRAARAGLDGLAAAMADEWRSRGLVVQVEPAEDVPAMVATLFGRR